MIYDLQGSRKLRKASFRSNGISRADAPPKI
jgi:hypothetical protein